MATNTWTVPELTTRVSVSEWFIPPLQRGIAAYNAIFAI